MQGILIPPAPTWPLADSDGPPFLCRECGGELAEYENAVQEQVSPQAQAEYCVLQFGKVYCRDCRAGWNKRRQRRRLMGGCRAIA